MKYLRHRGKKKRYYLKFKCNWLSKFVCLLLACLLLLNLVALVSTAVSNPVLCGITFLTVSNSKKKKKMHVLKIIMENLLRHPKSKILDFLSWYSLSVIPKKFPPVLKSSLSISC